MSKALNDKHLKMINDSLRPNEMEFRMKVERMIARVSFRTLSNEVLFSTIVPTKHISNYLEAVGDVLRAQESAGNTAEKG